MKKNAIIVISIILVLLAAFIIYTRYFQGKSGARTIDAKVAEFVIPENWGEVNQGSNDGNCGYTFWETNKNGNGEFVGVSFMFIVNNNDCGDSDCAANLYNILNYDLVEIRMSEVEYISENEDDYFDEFTFKSKTALKGTYILRDDDLFASPAEKKKNPRSGYKKGEVISVQSGDKCVIFYFETFEKHWEANKADWEALKKSIKFK